MRLYALTILRRRSDETEPTLLSAAYELSDFNYFQRSSVREFAAFFAKLIAKRVTLGERLSVDHENYVCYAYARVNGVIAVALCDAEYPQRVAFSLLGQVLDEFRRTFPESQYLQVPAEAIQVREFPYLADRLQRYQNPVEADPLMRIEKDLDETKSTLHQTIDSILERGVKLDQLVDKSNDLSLQSKMFYRTARKQNSCCNLS
ncbi:similar to v-SNARE protein of ER-Golgi docking complex [Cyanidioschyzon merolae strain 10D]|jgi:synaptobrevin family protein YKT6|uniref:Similar to v-SNARE protein of ER-Golgi docking complex n=1 Tax=Cyanidioschyzon merolae (strain NIES-3377 / 10D) TaxID=280699 RepID=M1VI81_CYAM1|nr:similar to v-SNARE protein of ER-Golgi docking complex [Cyanidioschyzon merolae strain 10D]BAM80738.1 similar to v-SNARE protein of ER-Golgi docking complex [Cyanidioschyzon merolae strain 10D]|eukprot:XP_005536774.1 similar to v-SNARE protein of ER-Golgi docking complex [Cyanidioschyzon merolae strain 10D]